jgi:hypothetical protein
MSSWHSYSSIFNLGHKAIQDLLKGEVLVEEKIDGSQISFGLIETDPGDSSYSPDEAGLSLRVRSKGAVMHPDAPEKMFTEGVNAVKAIQHKLHPNWTYRGEYLKKPKHNSLVYDRIPRNHVIIFDINTGEEEFLSYEAKKVEAERLGFEVVPLLYSGMVEEIDAFRGFLDTTAILGGQKIEGVVVKPVNYDLFGRDKKVLMGKFVSEAFKEVHSTTWKQDNPSSGDMLAIIGAKYCTAARWNKAIQHLREAGQLEDDVRDIGKIIKEVPEDIKKECEEEIKDALMGWAWPHIRRVVTRGLPEFYKERLLAKQFEKEG